MRRKKTGSLLLTAIMVILVLILTATSVSAEEIYYWEQVSEEGFGDLTNDYAWSMATYTPPGELTTEYLYVGTLNFNYSQPPNLINDGCEAYRTNGTMIDGKYVWEQVVGPNGTQFMIHPLTGRIIPATAGFGHRIPGIHNMIVHDGLLWASCFSPLAPLMIPEETATGFGTIWITNGTHWKLANIPGFGHGDATIRAIAVFNDELYAGTCKVGAFGDGANIYKYTGGPMGGDLNLVDPAAWTQVFSVTADEAYAFGFLTEFNGYLYAFGYGASHGGEIYRSSDGTSWEEVVGDAPGAGMPRGFGDDSNLQIPSAAVFQDKLYAGTYNRENHAEIWRTSNGINWEPVEQYGFGRVGKIAYRMTVYNNTLIVGIKNCLSGAEVWMSETGDPGTFEQININGMDGSMTIPPFDTNISRMPGVDQDGVRSFANYQGYLIAGTSSPPAAPELGPGVNLSPYAGCEIWRANGTTYVLPKNVDVNKTVWDPEAQEWVHEMEAPVNDTVRFRCEIRNIGSCNLTDIILWNSLSTNLEYAGNATIEPARINPPTAVLGPPIPTLEWDLNLSAGESVVIEYDADVVKCNGTDLNHLYARGYCEDNDRWDDDWDMVIVNATVPNPNISISKNVSTPFCSPGDVLKYTISYNNTGNVDLTGVVLNDMIPDNTTYVTGSLTGPSCTYYPSNRTIICEHIGTLDQGQDGEVTFEVKTNASVPYGTIIENCVAVTSDQAPPADSCAYTIVTIPVVPLLVNKTVLDPEAHEWGDKLNASIGDTVRFRFDVHNNETLSLTNIRVWDFSSRSLEYAGDATVRYPRGWTVHREPDFVVPLTINNVTIGTVLMWNFRFWLEPSKNIAIEYNATVVEYGYDGKDINIQCARGDYEETGEWGFGCDYVIVAVPVPATDPVPVSVPCTYHPSNRTIICYIRGEDGNVTFDVNRYLMEQSESCVDTIVTRQDRLDRLR